MTVRGPADELPAVGDDLAVRRQDGVQGGHGATRIEPAVYRPPGAFVPLERHPRVPGIFRDALPALDRLSVPGERFLQCGGEEAGVAGQMQVHAEAGRGCRDVDLEELGVPGELVAERQRESVQRRAWIRILVNGKTVAVGEVSGQDS